MERKGEIGPTSYHVHGPFEIRPIPLDRIRVINPRVRSQKVFAGIVESIATVGLKRPITVAESGSDEHGARYDLVCGQGRLEAFQALGEQEIPCVIVDAPEADRYLMSLVENLARRKHSNADLLGAVRALEQRGYNPQQIAKKTGLDATYVRGILHLLKEGEERLIGAVEKGWLPMTLAVKISGAGDSEV
ncbi:MAG: ParB N-terminal domain-containing protein, partial [Acetobacteraceae bacterium]|nr:ParB N-terminal domain-containing protein [Acetobacteraceae bacterium]